MPVFYKHISLNGPIQHGPGEINVPISIDNEVIYSGDIIVGDHDGIISIRPQEVESLFAAMDAKIAHVKQELIDIANVNFPLDWVDDKITSFQTEILDKEYQ